jgi:gamma-glutamylcyclotransferase (GGCT)/AIG2-like uncharacterized protein YtfP
MFKSATILFLYGSLKRGHENHRLVADQEFVGDAITQPGYRIIDLGRYPGLIRDEDCSRGVAGGTLLYRSGTPLPLPCTSWCDAAELARQ